MDELTLDREPDALEALGAAPTPSLTAGYDTIGSALRASAVTADIVEGGSKVTVNVTVCEGVVEMSESLKISQSLSVDYLGLVSVDQKLDFVRNQKATNESVSIVVYARHELGSQTARDPKLKPDLPGDPAKFARERGDSYIDSIERGGEYYAVYTFYTQTTEEQKSLVASLKAKGIFSKVTVNGSLETAIDNFTKTTKTNWRYDQEISGIRNPSPPPREQLIDYALKFPSIELDAPTVIGFTTAGYENVPGFSLDFQRIVANRRYFVGSTIDDGLTRSLLKIVSLQNKVAWLKGIYGCYGFTGDPELDAFGTLLEADRRTIRTQFEAYEDAPLSEFKHPALPSLDKGMPLLSFTKGTSPMFGSNGGNPFDYGMPIEDALANQRRLNWLQLRGNKYVDQIGLRYVDVHGEGPIQRFGQDGGSLQNALSFESNEFVKRVDSRTGDLVDRLRIETTRGAVTEVGRNGGDPHNWEVPQGTVVLGIQGRANKYLNAIQIVWAKLEPATFRKS
ncbi:hypothetical protein [Sphingomonas sp.]|uniref:jacalin-like lectin n=1 Tax=Sphingomonas sp. TaxID=28214 RepID=UPI001B193404|nr:hypothetical protein [Sphingomonas sp.]MBO9713207.1 hypothetical protein [Sphingomonas sp.]